MIELYSVEQAVPHPVQQVRHVEAIGRVVSLRLVPGAALPETRDQPVLLVAVTDLDLEVGAPGSERVLTLSLQAGDVEFLRSGVAIIRNTGRADAQFSLIDVRGTPSDEGPYDAP